MTGATHAGRPLRHGAARGTVALKGAQGARQEGELRGQVADGLFACTWEHAVTWRQVLPARVDARPRGQGWAVPLVLRIAAE